MSEPDAWAKARQSLALVQGGSQATASSSNPVTSQISYAGAAAAAGFYNQTNYYPYK